MNEASKVRKGATWLIVLSVFIVTSVFCGTARVHAEQGIPKSIIFGVPGVGGSLYVIGAGLSTVIGRYVPAKIITQSYPGMVPFTDGVARGRVNVAVANLYYAYSCSHGIGEFKRWGPRPLRVLGAGHSSHVAFFTTPKTGIKTIPDLAGKKVAYVSRVSVTSTKKNKLMLEYYGILDKVVAVKRGSLVRTAEVMIEGKIDAYGGPLGSHSEILKQAAGLVVIPVPPEVVEHIQKKDPLLFVVPEVAPKGLFGATEEFQSCGTIYYPFVKRECSDQVAYAITKAIYDHPKELAEIHRDLSLFTTERTLKFRPGVPFHPGAIRYYKEKGVWTSKVDDIQNKLVAEEKK